MMPVSAIRPFAEAVSRLCVAPFSAARRRLFARLRRRRLSSCKGVRKLSPEEKRPGVEKPGRGLECAQRFLYKIGMIPDLIVTDFD